MRLAGQRSHKGYKRRPGKYGGRPAMVVPNHLDRQFEPAEPNMVWAPDITYIRTHEGWLYLAVVLDRGDSGIQLDMRLEQLPVFCSFGVLALPLLESFTSKPCLFTGRRC